MTSNYVHIGEYSLYLKTKNTLLLLGGMFYNCQLDPVNGSVKFYILVDFFVCAAFLLLRLLRERGERVR